MPDIIFRDPPRTPGARGRTAPNSDHKVALALRAKAGQWAVLPANGRKKDSLAQAIKRGKSASFRAPDGKYETTVQGGDLYVRFVPDSVDA